MSVYRRGKVWYYHFEVQGTRFRGSTGVTEKAAAERITAKLRLEAAESVHFPKAKTMTLAEALLRYYTEHASHLPSAYTIYGYVKRLGVMGDKKLTEITDATIAEYVARRRGDQVRGTKKTRKLVANATVNHEVRCLRAVLRKAATWGAAVPTIEWKAHLLPEAGERTVYLTVDQERALIAALRPDFRPLVQFCLMTGARLTAAIRLTWRNVDYVSKRITMKVKGGGTHTVPLTPGLTILLANERGGHPVFVFTYEAAEDRPGLKGAKRKRGERYPFSKDGWRRVWKRAADAAGVPGFRFHDLRHTAGSRITKDAGIAVAQKLLGHANITTTRRYAHVLMDDVAAAMERVERSTNSHTDSADAQEAASNKEK
jgi:integrase